MWSATFIQALRHGTSGNRRGAIVSLVVAALAATVVPSVARAAGAPEPAASVAATSEDFATVAYGDPFDFANPQDLRLLPDRTTPALHSPRMESGEYRFNARGGASLTTFVFPGYPGALYMERDGGALPIDADRYTHLAMRIYSPSQRAMSFSFDRCLSEEFANQFCRTSTDNVILEPGWNTVVRDLRALTAGRQWPWAGKVYAFRMMNDVADGYRVSFLRLQAAPAAVEVTWDPGLGNELYWDLDDTTANNTPDAPGWGRVTGGTAGRASFPAGAMEAGSYRFYVRAAGGASSAYSSALRVAPRPAPVVLDPDLAGGEDFATVANGKPWDFSTPSDVIAHGGFTNGSFGPAGIQGTNNSNDPFFYLRMAKALDADRYHRLTVHASYEGAFNLADVAGGGTHGRLLWTRADRDQTHVIQGNKLIESRELVHYPGQASFTVDLKTPPDPKFVMETDRPERDGWSTGSPVTHLRYDPNEDRGARRWRIARVALRATDETSGNAFDIRWRDVSGATGVKVTLTYRPVGGGAERTIASDLPQTDGDNVYRWDTSAVAPGRYVIRVTGDDGVSQGSNDSTGPVDVRTSIRTSGPNRVATGAALSQLAFPNGAKAAVLARADGFADALAAAPLTAAVDGPLLLNASDRLDPAVRAELDRLGVETVYLMGGEAAQSATVEAALEASGREVVRLAGRDRFTTAVAAADEAAKQWRASGRGDVGRKVAVALGSDFPDALAAGPLTAHGRMPLLLTGRDEVPQATLGALDRLGATDIVIVGGVSAVSERAVAQLAEGRRVQRIAGASRHETAELAAREAVNAGAHDKVVLVASGRSFADALAAGPAAAKLGGVLLTTEADTLPAVTRGWVQGRRPFQVLRVVGGRAAISERLEAEIVTASSG